MASVNWSNVNEWGDLLAVVNTNTGSWGWFLIMNAIFVLLLLLFSVFGFEVGLLMASSVAFVFGMFLVYMGLVAWQWLLIYVGLILFVMIYIGWTSRK